VLPHGARIETTKRAA